MKRPTISVIVPVFNRSRELQICLEALSKQIDPPEEIFVVDNNSTENIKNIVRKFPKVAYLSEPFPGASAARNLGIRHATGDVLAFTDSDCRPAFDWIKQAREYFSHRNSADIAGGKIIFDLPKNVTPVSRFDSLYNLRQEWLIKTVGFSLTANLFAKRMVIQKIKGFNTKLYSSEDAEFCLKAKRAGFSIEYLESVVIFHPAITTLSGLLKKTRKVAGGMQIHRQIKRQEKTLEPAKKRRRLQAIREIINDTTVPSVEKVVLIWLKILTTGIGYLETRRVRMGGQPLRDRD